MPATILIIEDDLPSLELIRYLAGAAGHSILTADDGRSGLRLAMKAQPDLVLCDLQMPDLDGYELIRSLRAEPDWRRVPVAAVTAQSMPGDREAAVAAGFDAFITKPIVPETFVRQIEALLPGELRSVYPESHGEDPGR